MKKILKMILGLAAGCLLGVFVGLGAAVVFGGKTWAEVLSKVANIDVTTIIIPIFIMTIGLVVAFVLQIIVHEAGHLVAGLLTGYRFVSFRILSLTLIKRDGHLRLSRYSLGSTGGQCLMAPPLRPIEEIDTRWYNLGGVLANILLSIAALLVCLLFDLPSEATIIMVFVIFFGLFMAITNGIPMKVGGMNNDGYNLFHLEKSPLDKRILCKMLEANARMQNGEQPRQLPDEMFSEEGTGWSDALQVNWQLMVVTRMINQQRWEEAYTLMKEGLSKKDSMPKLFFLELSLEMVFVCLATGRTDEARQLYDKELSGYLKKYVKTHSSKARILCAIELLMNGNRDEALRIKDNLTARRNDFLMQGEVAMDIELMSEIIKVKK